MHAPPHARTPACTHPRMYAPPHVRTPACTHPRMYAPPHVRTYADVHACISAIPAKINSNKVMIIKEYLLTRGYRDEFLLIQIIKNVCRQNVTKMAKKRNIMSTRHRDVHKCLQTICIPGREIVCNIYHSRSSCITLSYLYYICQEIWQEIWQEIS